MTVLRGAAWACALVAGSLVVAGCTPDEPEPTPTTPVETSATSSAPETSEPTVAAPEMPAEASEASAAGAEAYVTYWIDLLNYAKATGDVAPVTRASGQECDVCSGAIESVEETYERGARIEGSEMVASDVRSPAPDSQNLVAVAVTFTEGEGYEVYPDGRREPRETTAPTQVDFVMVYEGGSWELKGVGTR